MEELVFEEEGASSAFAITLGDVFVFINWMNQTEKSLARAEALPLLPELDSSKVKGWIQLVQRLEERFRLNEEKTLALEVRDCEIINETFYGVFAILRGCKNEYANCDRSLRVCCR